MNNFVFFILSKFAGGAGFYRGGCLCECRVTSLGPSIQRKRAIVVLLQPYPGRRLNAIFRQPILYEYRPT
jgi:hypothetical protein